MAEFQPRGREIHRLPRPWPGLGMHRSTPEVFGCVYPGQSAGNPADWYGDAREKFMTEVDPANVEAAGQDLVATLTERPTTFWCIGAAEGELADKYSIPRHLARQLMRDCPGAAVPQPNVWCSKSAAGDWIIRKARVLAEVRSDALLTFDELASAVSPDVDVGHVVHRADVVGWRSKNRVHQRPGG